MGSGFVAGTDGGGDVKNYPGKVTWCVGFICVVGAMGGLIFGYDIGISGGVTSMAPFLKEFFPGVYRREALDGSTNQYCSFNDQRLVTFTSSLYLAALVASFFASSVTSKLGRKVSMLLGGLIFFAGALFNGFAQNLGMLIAGRILLGIGVGFSVQSVPLYVSEMAPCKWRGALNVQFQLFITVGIFVANLVNYFTPKFAGDEGWRYSLGGASVPAFIIVVSAIFLPNTPNSMLEKGQAQEAREMLRRIRGISDTEVEEEFRDLVKASEASKRVENPWSRIITRPYRPHLSMALLIPSLQQLTGINVVMFYAPVLFKSIGFKDDASLLSAVITGLVNLLSTIISVYSTDKWGRRKLFLAGGIQMFIFQMALAVLIGWKFGTSGQVTNLPSWYAILVVTFICVFVNGFAYSWGPLGWLVPSELFPLEVRSAAFGITASVNMMVTFCVAQLFLIMLCHMKFGLFIFFAVFLAAMTAYVYFFLPETKNIPIEEMSVIWRGHWFWKRFVADHHHDPAAQEMV